MFGTIFVASGLIAGAVGVGSVALVITMGSQGGIVEATVGTLMALAFGGVFVGVGLKSLSSARNEVRKHEGAYEQGVPHIATVTEISRSSYMKNNRRAYIYHYAIELPAGSYTGTYDSWNDLKLDVGDEIVVLYDPDDPSINLLYNPENPYPSSLRDDDYFGDPTRGLESSDGSNDLEHGGDWTS